MATLSPSTGFDLTGNFGGFVFTATGKRRMVLRVGEQNLLLKVPRLLRRRVIGTFRVDQPVRVGGTEERDSQGSVIKRIVDQIVPANVDLLPPPVRAASICTIKVCAKKNCWRSGGQELSKSLKQAAAASGLAEQVEIKAVGCLDRCEQAPNVDSPWREYRRCSPRDASAILAEIVARLAR